MALAPDKHLKFDQFWSDAAKQLGGETIVTLETINPVGMMNMPFSTAMALVRAPYQNSDLAWRVVAGPQIVLAQSGNWPVEFEPTVDAFEAVDDERTQACLSCGENPVDYDSMCAECVAERDLPEDGDDSDEIELIVDLDESQFEQKPDGSFSLTESGREHLKDLLQPHENLEVVTETETPAATAETVTPEYPDTRAGFKQMIQDGDYIILDTETTGLHSGEIVQIAIVDSSGDVLLNTLVKPTKPIPPDATAIHGITDEMCKDAPAWTHLQSTVMSILKTRSNLVIYNAAYDLKMLRFTDKKHEIGVAPWESLSRVWCAMLQYAEHYGEWNSYHGNYRWQKLSYAARREGVNVIDAHTALGDCLMALGVVQAMSGVTS